jgi:hypothetical protein
MAKTKYLILYKPITKQLNGCNGEWTGKDDTPPQDWVEDEFYCSDEDETYGLLDTYELYLVTENDYFVLTQQSLDDDTVEIFLLEPGTTHVVNDISYCYIRRFLISNRFVVQSDLNGNNGSVTNTDDTMKGPPVEKGSRTVKWQLPREFKRSTLNNRGSSRRGGNQYGPPKNDELENDEDYQRAIREAVQGVLEDMAPTEPEIEYVETVFAVVSLDATVPNRKNPPQDLTWIGNTFATRMNNSAFFQNVETGEYCPRITEGAIVENVKNSGLGFVEIVSVKKPDVKYKTVVARGCWQWVTSPVRKLGGTQWEYREGYIFLPLFNALKKQLPCAMPSASTLKTVVSFADKMVQYLLCPEEFKTWTVEYWFRLKVIQITLNDRLTCVRSYFGEDLRAAPQVVDVDIHRHGFLTGVNDHGDVWRTESSVCELSQDWETTCDAYVVCSEGVEVRGMMFNPSTNEVTDNRQGFTMFETMVRVKPPEYRTNYFGFISELNRFVQYEDSPHSATLALSRFLKIRQKEDIYIKNQSECLYYLQKHIERLSISSTSVQSEGMNVYLYKPVSHVNSSAILAALQTEIKEPELKSNINRYSGKPEIIVAAPFDQESRSLKIKEPSYTDKCFYDFMSSRIAQSIFQCSRTTIQRWVDKYNGAKDWAYYRGYLAWVNFWVPHMGRNYAKIIPHLKKMLRIAYVNGVRLHVDSDNMVRRLNACVKIELAKFGKVPRFFVSYDAGCMYANELPEFVKVCIDGHYVIEGTNITTTIFIMAKPRSESLDLVFNSLIESTQFENSVFIAIYSDDSCVAGNIRGMRFAFNADITSCDSSNKEYIFYQIGMMIAQFNLERAVGILSKCMMPVNYTNPYNKKETFSVHFTGPFEGSGAEITTSLNHQASSSIGHSIHFWLDVNFFKFSNIAEIGDCIIYAAERVGHLVTVESCTSGEELVFEKLQFLKYSPILNELGEWIPSRNLGAILRSFGSTRADFTGDRCGIQNPDVWNLMTTSDKCDHVMGQRVESLKHEPSSIIIDAMRHRFPGPTIVTEVGMRHDDYNQSVLVMEAGWEPKSQLSRLEIVSLCRRYDLEVHELEELAIQMQNVVVGREYISHAITQIYLVDYGLKSHGGDLE